MKISFIIKFFTLVSSISLIVSFVARPAFAQNRNDTKFGMYYLIWHCPEINIWSYHFGIPDMTEILAGKQVGFPGRDNAGWAPVPFFHFWGKPQLGYYCLSQNETVLRQHAAMLHNLGIDFVFVDSTNFNETDNELTGAKGREMDPFLKLVQVWSTIPDAPKIVPWLRITGNSNTMADFFLNVLDQYPSMKFYFQGKPLLFTGFGEYSGAPVNYTKLDQLKNNYTIRMMKGLGDDALSQSYPNWYWLSLCTSGFRESNGTQTCNQTIANVNGQLEEVPIASAYQTSYMSYTDAAVPKFDGRTLQKQFETLFKNPGPPIALIVGWNELMAQRFCLDSNGSVVASNCNDQNDHWPNGNKIFVDQYNKEYNRDIEPAENDKGDLYYKIAKACIALYKQEGTFNANNSSSLCINTPTYIHGYVDGYRCDNSSWNFAGWATDDRNHNQKLTVRAEVYPDNEPYNKVSFTAAANSPRPDLTGVCPTDGSCAYGIQINSIPESFRDKKLRAHVYGVAPDGEMEIEFPSANNIFGPCNNLISSPPPTSTPIPPSLTPVPSSTPIPPSPTPTPIPGDIYPVGHPDGKVDINDYNLLIGDFGKTNSPADINGNGIVDIYDYNTLVGNFGKNH